MPTTRPRELQFWFGLVDLVVRDILTQAQRAENGVRRAAVLGSYELLNCFVTVRRNSNVLVVVAVVVAVVVTPEEFLEIVSGIADSAWPLDNLAHEILMSTISTGRIALFAEDEVPGNHNGPAVTHV